MQKHRLGYLVCLGLILLLAVWGGGFQAQAQFRRFMDQTVGDFTWGLYGGSREYSRLGREDAVAREGYCPTGGCVLRLDDVAVRPSSARKGDTLVLSTTYTVLTPEQVDIPIAITREIIFQGKSLGRTKSIDTRQANGRWTQEVDFTLPKDALAGDYTLRTRVSTGYGMDQKDTQFQVY